MKVVMLAAGIGSRLGATQEEQIPKVLLRFGGKSLLQRHIEIFQRRGIKEMVLAVGFRHEEVEREIAAIGAQDFVRTVLNKDYTEGNIVTLWTVREDLCTNEPVLLMDADVLYDEEIIARLIKSPHENCLLIDRDFDPGDEPVKICIRGDQIIEFRKWLTADFDYCGESIGFFKLSPQIAKQLIDQTGHYIAQSLREAPYEDAIRDLLLTAPSGTFACEDATGVPWIEIDFQEDVERAKNEILPRIKVS